MARMTGGRAERAVRQPERISARPQFGLELMELESIHPKEATCAVEASAGVPDRVEH
jgi:hypothetical protein